MYLKPTYEGLKVLNIKLSRSSTSNLKPTYEGLKVIYIFGRGASSEIFEAYL